MFQLNLWLCCSPAYGYVAVEPVIPPFKPVGKHVNLLLIKESRRDVTVRDQLQLSDVYTPSKAFKYLASDQFRSAVGPQSMAYASGNRVVIARSMLMNTS